MKKLLAVLCFALFSTALVAQAATGFTKIANTSGAAYTDGTCPNQSSCYYQVLAVDAQGFESVPSPCLATQLCVGGNIAVAIMPSSGTHTVALTWTASTTTGVTYNVYRHIGPLSGSNFAAVVN